MGGFYYAASSLPPLSLEGEPPLHFADFCNLLRMNFSDAEMANLHVLQRLVDIDNIRCLLEGRHISTMGSLTAAELDEAVAGEFHLPDYILRYLVEYEKVEDRLANFDRLLSWYFADETSKAQGFLLNYLEFERQWRLVLLGFRAKVAGKDLSKELQWEDSSEDLVAGDLSKHNCYFFVPPQPLTELS